MQLRTAGAGLMAALALTLVSTATAAEFELSKAGTIKLVNKANLTQVFGLPGDPLTCRTVKGTVYSPSLKTSSLLLLLTYSGCETNGGVFASVTTAPVLFDANGSMGIVSDKADAFVFTVPALSCSVLVQTGGANTLLGTIKYTNTTGKVTSAIEVEEMLQVIPEGSNNNCGTVKVPVKVTYFGDTVSELEGGTIMVK